MLELQTFDAKPTLRKSLEPDYATTMEPAIDLVHLARQTDGDDVLEADLLAMFDRQAAKIVAKLSAGEASAQDARGHRAQAARLGAGDGGVARGESGSKSMKRPANSREMAGSSRRPRWPP